jgi:beta-N-acetylhexosaminidase
LLRRRLGFRGLVLSDDLEMGAVRSTWGVGGAAVRFLAAGGDLALVCREAGTRDEAVAAVERALATGAVAPEAAADARRRRAALRQWVERTRPRPDTSVIGSAEHRELLAEILRRAAPSGPPAPG